MSREQIEEMTRDLCRSGSCTVEEWAECSLHRTDGFCAKCNSLAEHLYNAGYRKQSEGHWFILEYEYFTCSECGYYHPNGCDSTQEAKEKLADGKVPKYCSECGAKLKGGAENDI